MRRLFARAVIIAVVGLIDVAFAELSFVIVEDRAAGRCFVLEEELAKAQQKKAIKPDQFLVGAKVFSNRNSAEAAIKAGGGICAIQPRQPWQCPDGPC